MREVELVRRIDKMGWDREAQGGHSIRMGLMGARGAVSFTYVPDLPVYAELKRIMAESGLGHEYPWGVDLSYHSIAPLREWQVATEEEVEARADEFLVSSRECELTRTGRCFTDGSSMRGDEVGVLLREEGEDAVWEFLADHYHRVFYEELTLDNLGFADVLKMLGA